MRISNLAKAIISIVLLLTLYPIGLIVMWLITPWSRGFKIFLTFLFFFPFIFLLLLLPFATFNKAQKQVNQPSQAYKTYKDELYSINFNYPDNWFIKVHDTDQKALEISKERFLSTPIRTISFTDKPYPSDRREKMPFCVFSVEIHRNPQNLFLKEWYEKTVDEGREPPKNEEEMAARNLLLETNTTKINNIDALQTLGGDYVLANNKAVFRINQFGAFECFNGFKVPLNSLKAE